MTRLITVFRVAISSGLIPIVLGIGKAIPRSSKSLGNLKAIRSHDRKLKGTFDQITGSTIPLPPLVEEFKGDTNVLAGEDALAELSIDVNPTNPDNQVIVGHTSNLASMNTLYTFDGGKTWVSNPLNAGDDGITGTITTERVDPTLTFDDDGNLYVGYGVLVDRNTATPNIFVVVCRSTDGGVTYPQCTSVDDDPGYDKWLLAAGPSPNDSSTQNVYIVWEQSVAPNRNLLVSFWTPGSGGFFSPPTRFDDVAGVYKFPDPAVDSNGVVYVSWWDIGTGDLFLDRSFDGGVTWGNDIVVRTFDTIIFKTSIPAQPTRGVFNGPTLDVDRSGCQYDGRLYIAYCDSGFGGTSNTNVLVISSDDGGVSWTDPVIVHDDFGGSSQFLPWLDVDQETGLVSTVWYDTRNDPTDAQAEVFLAVSEDGGATWGENTRVSDNPSDMSGNPNSNADYLEYIGVASLCGQAFPAWTDNSACDNSDVDYYTAQFEIVEYNTIDKSHRRGLKDGKKGSHDEVVDLAIGIEREDDDDNKYDKGDYVSICPKIREKYCSDKKDDW